MAADSSSLSGSSSRSTFNSSGAPQSHRPQEIVFPATALPGAPLDFFDFTPPRSAQHDGGGDHFPGRALKNAEKCVTQELVDQLIDIYLKTCDCDSVAGVVKLAREYNIDLTQCDPNKLVDVRTARKALQLAYIDAHLPHSESNMHHRVALLQLRDRMVKYFTERESLSTLAIFGSYTTGKATSILSDLDFLVIVRKEAKETEIIRGMKDIGLVFSTSSQWKELKQVAETGERSCRLYALSQDGIPVEFHVIGEASFDRLDSFRVTDSVHRVTPAPAKMEQRISFTGKRKDLPKPGDYTPNYLVSEGEVFRGFFLEAALTAEVVYKPSAELCGGDAPAVQSFRRIGRTQMGALLYHTERLVKLPNNRLAVCAEGLSWESSELRTLFINSRERYTQVAAGRLQDRFVKRLEDFCAHHGAVLSNCQTGELRGPVLDRTTQKLHDLRAKGVKVAAFDFDGTIYSRADGGMKEAAKLILDIASRGVTPAIITARDATLFNEFIPHIESAYAASEDITLPAVFFGVANGARVVTYDYSGLTELRSHEIHREAYAHTVNLYRRSVGASASQELVARLKENTGLDWGNLITKPYLEITRRFDGVWAERSKISLVLPDAVDKRAEVVERLRRGIHPALEVQWSHGSPLVDVTPRLKIDPKLDALKFIVTQIGMSEKALYDADGGVVTFGDSPDGNDAGLLSVANGFTNRSSATHPAFYIEGPERGEVSPVQRVHRAAEFLTMRGV